LVPVEKKGTVPDGGDTDMVPRVPPLQRETTVAGSEEVVPETQRDEDEEVTSDEAEAEAEKSEPSPKKRKFPIKPKKPLPESAPECAKCLHDKEHRVPNPSAYNTFLKQFEAANPTLDAFSCKIRARQLYVPQSGKRKSFERVYRDTYMAHHPSAKKLDDDTLRKNIREAFVNETFSCGM